MLKRLLIRRGLAARLVLLLGWWFMREAAQAELAGTNAPAGLPPLSLSEAKKVAFERNWDLLAAKSGTSTRRGPSSSLPGRISQSHFFLISTARLGSHDSATPLGNGIYSRNYDTILQINQLIEIAGKRRDRQVGARAGSGWERRARFFGRQTRTLDQGVTKAYLAALLAAGKRAESQRILRLPATGGEDRRRAVPGRGPFRFGQKNELKLIPNNLTVQAKAAAEASRVQARISVSEVLLGLQPSPRGDWTPADSPRPIGGNGSAARPEPATPEGERPDVLAAEAGPAQRAGRNCGCRRPCAFPDPTFSIGVEHNPPGGGPGIGPDVNTLIAGFSFPLPLWNLNGGEYQGGAGRSVDQFAGSALVQA